MKRLTWRQARESKELFPVRGVCKACYDAGIGWSDPADDGSCFECRAPINPKIRRKK